MKHYLVILSLVLTVLAGVAVEKNAGMNLETVICASSITSFHVVGILFIYLYFLHLKKYFPNFLQGNEIHLLTRECELCARDINFKLVNVNVTTLKKSTPKRRPAFLLLSESIFKTMQCSFHNKNKNRNDGNKPGTFHVIGMGGVKQ